MKNVLRVGAAIALIAGGVAACGPPPVIAGAGGTITATSLPNCPIDALAKYTPTGGKRIQVTLWHGLGVEPKRALDRMVAKYNASQNKVQVSALQQGTSYDEVLRKYQAAASTSGLPGAIYVEDTSTQRMVDTGTLMPSEACMKATKFDLTRYEPLVRAYYTVDDVFWPAYANVSGPVLYYNASHFAKAGLDPTKPPTTLEEMRTAALALKKIGISKPIALKLDEWYLECWLVGAGDQVVNNNDGRDGKPTKATFNTPNARKVLSLLQQMKREGLLQGYSDTDGQLNQFLALASQKSSMTIETSTAASTIKAFLAGNLQETPAGAADNVNKKDLDPKSAAFPGLSAPGRVRVSGGAYYMVRGTAKQKTPPEVIAGAWDFFSFMSRPENVATLQIEGGYLPVISPAEKDPRLAAFYKNDVAGQLVVPAREQLGNVSPKQPGPLIGPYLDYAEALRGAMDAAVLQNQPVEPELVKATKTVDTALATNN